MDLSPEIKNHRNPEYPVDPLFLSRWSPRAMTGESIDNNTLMTLFEAAKWAPSSGNTQFWRFIYAHRNTPAFEKLYNLLAEGNKIWADKGGVLVLILSSRLTNQGKNARTHSFDTGMAWMNFLLQATLLNLAVHTMEGFDYDKAREAMHIPEEFAIEAMGVIGKKAPKALLTPNLQEREFPKGRRPLSETIMSDTFKRT